MRVVLFGGPPDPAVFRFLEAVEPRSSGADVEFLLILDHLGGRGWIDPRSAGPVLQRSEAESEAALRRAGGADIGGSPVLAPVAGCPVGEPPAYRLSDQSREVFAHRLEWARTPEGREALILDWARRRGRVSSTEAADLTGVTVPYAGKLLGRLADDGALAGSRPKKAGRGFHYLPVN